MTSPAGTLLIGIFERTDQAGQACEELRRAGFVDEDLGFVTPGRREEAGASTSPAIAEPTPGSVGVGGGIGAVIGGIAGGGVAMAIPGIGPIIAGGLFALAGASMGALASSFFGLSVPEEEARYYEHQLHLGKTLLAVRADGRRHRALTILRSHGGRVRAEEEPHPFSPDAESAS